MSTSTKKSTRGRREKIKTTRAVRRFQRPDGRRADALREVTLIRRFTRAAPGSVMIKSGDTHVLCTASVEESVPAWRAESGLGWLTAEYDMLPASTGERRARNRGGRIDGRTQEIQRLIGRSLRAVVDMAALGPRTMWIDCDVVQADGGTRTAAITGSFVALSDAVADLLRRRVISADPITDAVAAVSVGLVDGHPLLDLCYEEDHRAEVDFNLVLTGRGRFVEVQGSAEAGTFTESQMATLLALGRRGIARLFKAQRNALAGRARVQR